MAGARLGHKVLKNVSRIGKKVVKGVAIGAGKIVATVKTRRFNG